MTDVFIAIGTISTLLVVLATLYLEFVKPWRKGPRFSTDFGMAEPFCRTATMEGTDIEAYYLRVKVKNSGKSVAKRCVGKLIAVMDRDGAGSDKYDPMPLHWVGTDAEACPLSPIDLNPDDYEYLDVLQTMEGKRQAFICTDRELRGIRKHLNPGQHILHITVYGDGVTPKTQYLSLDWRGETFKEISMAMHDEVRQAKDWIKRDTAPRSP